MIQIAEKVGYKIIRRGSKAELDFGFNWILGVFISDEQNGEVHLHDAKTGEVKFRWKCVLDATIDDGSIVLNPIVDSKTYRSTLLSSSSGRIILYRKDDKGVYEVEYLNRVKCMPYIIENYDKFELLDKSIKAQSFINFDFGLWNLENDKYDEAIRYLDIAETLRPDQTAHFFFVKAQAIIKKRNLDFQYVTDYLQRLNFQMETRRAYEAINKCVSINERGDYLFLAGYISHDSGKMDEAYFRLKKSAELGNMEALEYLKEYF